jgi:hypothetical protein
MPYQRKSRESKPSKREREALLQDYWNFYSERTKIDPSALNRKIPREAFTDLLNELGTLISDRANELASHPGVVRQFLDANPLPPSLAHRLPDDFRVFCLALNALKQWVAAEQAATDRYLLGGSARRECLESGDVCLVTGDLLGEKVELHHPVRDGRPPVPLSVEGHHKLEGQERKAAERKVMVPASLTAYRDDDAMKKNLA